MIKSMDVELERVINPYPPSQMPTLIISDDDIAAYEQSASTMNIANPKTAEILNQPTAREYRYMRPKLRRY